MTDVVPFEPALAPGVAALAEAEGWPTFSDPDRVRRLFAAPGVVCAVAVHDSAVVGAAHVLTDGHHAYLTTMVVAASARREGVGRQLVDEAFRRTGAVRMDLLTTPAADAFYRSLPSQEFVGFRLYPS